MVSLKVRVPHQAAEGRSRDQLNRLHLDRTQSACQTGNGARGVTTNTVPAGAVETTNASGLPGLTVGDVNRRRGPLELVDQESAFLTGERAVAEGMYSARANAVDKGSPAGGPGRGDTPVRCAYQDSARRVLYQVGPGATLGFSSQLGVG